MVYWQHNSTTEAIGLCNAQYILTVEFRDIFFPRSTPNGSPAVSDDDSTDPGGNMEKGQQKACCQQP
jgi:hypothetical protein